MRRRRWSSRGGWTPEWRARCRSHGPRGSWGWWKWITNKHKSGKLQASAPELPRLRKTIKQRQTLWRRQGEEKAKKNWWWGIGGGLTGSQKATETEPQCFHSPRLVCGSPVLIFSPAPSAGIKVNSLTAPLAREMTPLHLHYGGGSGRLAWDSALTAIVRHTWHSGDPRTGIRRQLRMTAARNILLLLNLKVVQLGLNFFFFGPWNVLSTKPMAACLKAPPACLRNRPWHPRRHSDSSPPSLKRSTTRQCLRHCIQRAIKPHAIKSRRLLLLLYSRLSWARLSTIPDKSTFYW